MTIISHPIFLSLLSAIVGGLVVAIANHLMTKKRDVEAKRREIALTKLVDAWLALDAAAEKPGIRDGELEKLEEAVRILVLFGEDEDIDLAENAVKSIQKNQPADWTELQKSLRKKIRDRMGIKGQKRHLWFAIAPQNKDQKKR
jgi:hypothetical protein